MKATNFIAVIGAILISGCAYNTAPYGASVANVTKIKAANIKAVSVAPFSSTNPGNSTITCRAAGPVTVKPSFESYIQSALIDELKLSSVYDPDSKIVISGRLESIDFSSGITDGNWSIALTISNNQSQSFTTKSTSPFSGSFVADKACQEVAQAFSPAVQKLIHDVVSNPQFANLAK